MNDNGQDGLNYDPNPAKALTDYKSGHEAADTGRPHAESRLSIASNGMDLPAVGPGSDTQGSAWVLLN